MCNEQEHVDHKGAGFCQFKLCYTDLDQVYIQVIIVLLLKKEKVNKNIFTCRIIPQIHKYYHQTPQLPENCTQEKHFPL